VEFIFDQIRKDALDRAWDQVVKKVDDDALWEAKTKIAFSAYHIIGWMEDDLRDQIISHIRKKAV